MNVLFGGPCGFPISYSNRDTPWNALNRHSGSVMVDTKSPSHNCYMKLWPLTSYCDFPNEYFPLIPWRWYRAWPSTNYEWFPWSICNGCQQGTLTLSDIWFCPPFWDLCSSCWDRFSRNCRVFSRLFTLNTPWLFRFCLPLIDLRTQNNRRVKIVIIDLYALSQFCHTHNLCSLTPEHCIWILKEKKEEIWLSPMTKAPTPTENPKRNE